MSDTGPTTAGSIVGKLRMDRDEWLADYQKTKQEAREIAGLTPTIKVDANITEALAKLAELKAAYASTSDNASITSRATPALAAAPTARTGSTAGTDAVTAAARRLAAAESASESATARAIVAEMRLEESRAKHGRTAAQIAAAELTAAEAIKRSEAAAEKATFAETALAAAQQKAAAAALQQAAAQEAAERQTVKANEANRTNVSRLGMIATAVGVLLPMLVPVAAGAVGIAGALTFMGVAGIAAIFGIRKEMADGSATGKAYADGIGTIKNVLDVVSRTSAVAMLSSFQKVVKETTGSLPMLNRQASEFSTLLGRSGANLFSGTITGARVLEPLLLTTGAYLESLTQKFDRWTKGTGLQTFANYALTALPQVERVLGALANAVMHILEALAPLGSVGLSVLTVVSETISAIPVDVLSSLIGAIVWGTLAFKAWGFIAPMLSTIATGMGAVGVATTIATGPIGWVAAAVGALAAVFAVVASNQQRATEIAKNYTAAVQADSGVIGQNTRASAAKALQDAGAFTAAQKLGISTKLVTDATLGDTAAKTKLSAQMAEATARTKALIAAQGGFTGEKGKALVTSTNLLSDAVSGQNEGIKESIDKYNAYQQAIGGVTVSTKKQRDALEAEARAAGTTTAALLAAKSGQEDAGAATERTTALMYLQNDAAGLLRMTLDKLNGKTISAEQAQNQFDSQLANMGAHIDKTGKDIDRATASLEGNTAAAVANRGELISSVQSAQNAAQAYRDQTDANGKLSHSSEETRQKLIEMKQAIIDHAVEVGEDRNQVQQYIDKLFQIPASIPPTKLEVDTAAALAQVDAFVAGVRARSVSINVRADLPDVGDNRSGLSRPGVANGGTIGALADGGTGGGTVNGPGTAWSDTAGLYRLANGEEVISNKFGQADRQRQLLKAINAGQTFAVGAAHAPSQAPTQGGGTTKMITYSPTFTQVVGTSQAVDDGLRRLSMLRS